MFCQRLAARLQGQGFIRAYKQQQSTVYQVREIGDGRETNEEKEDSSFNGRPHKTCPFVCLTKNLHDYLGVLGASIVLGVKIQQNHDMKVKKYNRRAIGPMIPHYNPSVLRELGWIAPFLLRASPTLRRPQSITYLPENSPTNEVSSTLPHKIREYKKDFERLAQDYVKEIRNHVGLSLITSNHGEEGVEYLKANETCSRALYNLAVAYESGQHVSGQSKPDLNLAFEYYDRAAKMNHKFATYNLALFYLYGKGPIDKDLEEGTRLLEKAHGMGVKEASAFKDLKEMLEKRSVPVRTITTTSSSPNFLTSFFSSKQETDSKQEPLDSQDNPSSSSQPVRWAVCF